MGERFQHSRIGLSFCYSPLELVLLLQYPVGEKPKLRHGAVIADNTANNNNSTEIERKVTLFHSNMKPLQTLAGQALRLTAEQFPHRHRNAITTLKFKKQAKEY
ncbi:unnamed protein product [Vicia faba]|uniref:Uncharacterized protein n=1 Tax=Vicia faba TaxID=3906 RepID=A0AAV0ZSA2_VICFA|nr:unnamed protein product [Vicia faba]